MIEGLAAQFARSPCLTPSACNPTPAPRANTRAWWRSVATTLPAAIITARRAWIPKSAHGTNPATAQMCGMDVVVVNCDDTCNVELAGLQAKAAQHADKLAALMITYPSTHGVFEEAIREICATVHQCAWRPGSTWMALNLNAQVGLTSPPPSAPT